MGMLEVKVDGLALDMTTNSPVVILAPLELSKVLPIWIGHSEAWAIAMELSGVGSKRPMTHDLLKMVINTLSAKVEKVEITELKEQTFYARVTLTSSGSTYAIDARPSDSIALALKSGAPIYVEETLFNLKESDQPSELSNDPESLADRLRKINPEDFGKYSL
ncbi:MAG: bifunctional nuclease family protein [candidate division Zixibacteria bacterium]|nr:bifunctional nuclease family protein [candidate division Zixibacteria bacterium]